MTVSKASTLAMKVVCCGLVLASFLAPGSLAQTTAPKPVVLIIDRENGRFVYKLDNKIVPTPKMIERLGERLPAGGPRPAPGLILLVHPDVSLRMIGEAEGLVTKVGFDWPRVFVFSRNKQFMTELKFSQKPVKYSADGKIPDAK